MAIILFRLAKAKLKSPKYTRFVVLLLSSIKLLNTLFDDVDLLLWYSNNRALSAKF